MTGRFVLKIGDHLENGETKKYYTERNFSEVAPRYDFITRVLSFGRDAAWKRTLISLLPSHQSPVCVDLACGTGDIAFLLASKYPRGRIAGVDITEPMLDIARHRNTHPNVSFTNQDMGSLDIVSESVDIVTGGYALRNAPDLGTAIDEISRVLKPCGVAAFLDFSKPGGKIPQKMEYWGLKIWTGLWGTLLHRNHEVYSYIAESLQRFPDRPHLRDIFRDKGFSVIDSRLFFGGVTELLMVQKLRHAKRHDRCLSESYRHRCAPPSIWCDRVGFLPRLQLGFLACMNDILNGGGAEDFLHWAVPGEHAVLDAVEESVGLPKELLARSRQIAPPVESMLFEAAGR